MHLLEAVGFGREGRLREEEEEEEYVDGGWIDVFRFGLLAEEPMASTTTMRTVTSADGTPIAYERTGHGPPLVLVHGVAGDHTRWELFGVRSALAEHHTVYAMDRRGRGESGDASEYALEREFEDVAAVVDSIGEPVNLWATPTAPSVRSGRPC